MKMYILIKRGTPDNMVPVIAAHSSLVAYLNFEDDADLQQWLKLSFKKVVCTVTPEEFEFVRALSKCKVITESSLDGAEVALVFCPRKNYPLMFRDFPLWAPIK